MAAWATPANTTSSATSAKSRSPASPPSARNSFFPTSPSACSNCRSLIEIQWRSAWLGHEPSRFLQACLNGARDVLRPFETPDKRIDRLPERCGRYKWFDFPHCGNHDGNVFIWIHQVFHRVASTFTAIAVELKQADAVVRRRGISLSRVERRLGKRIGNGGDLLHLAEPLSRERIDDVSGHRAALGWYLVEIEASPNIFRRGWRSGGSERRTRYASRQYIRFRKPGHIYRVVLVAPKQQDRVLPGVADIKPDMPQCRAAAR